MNNDEIVEKLQSAIKGSDFEIILQNHISALLDCETDENKALEKAIEFFDDNIPKEIKDSIFNEINKRFENSNF